MYLDYHVHSSFSDDSVYQMEDIIKRAINLDIDEICFTEHVDYGVKVDVNSNPAKARVDYPKTESDMAVMSHFHHEIHDCKCCKNL